MTSSRPMVPVLWLLILFMTGRTKKTQLLLIRVQLIKVYSMVCTTISLKLRLKAKKTSLRLVSRSLRTKEAIILNCRTVSCKLALGLKRTMYWWLRNNPNGKTNLNMILPCYIKTTSLLALKMFILFKTNRMSLL